MAQSESRAQIRAMLRWEMPAGEQVLYLREGDTAQIGREPGSDLMLNSLLISRRHAIITWREDGFDIQDLSSMNGTLVNDEPARQPRRLQDGDIIRMYDIRIVFNHSIADTPSDTGPRLTETYVVLPAVPRARLIISAGPQEGREILLRAGKMIIGRATSKETWDIALQDRAISRPQAKLEYSDSGYLLTDLGSVNGTWVNGVRISEATLMQDGDVVLVGETTLLFRIR